MFNLLAGQGLGFKGSQELAFGLAPVFSGTLPETPGDIVVGGGIGGGGFYSREAITLYDNLYSMRKTDDFEIAEILSILFGVIE